MVMIKIPITVKIFNMTVFISLFLIIIVLVNIITVLTRKIINTLKNTNITDVIIRITPVLHVKSIMVERGNSLNRLRKSKQLRIREILTWRGEKGWLSCQG